MMNTLIIHPKDETTSFLETIYADVQQKKVITGDATNAMICNYIKQSESVMMLGHGVPNGLMAVNQFPDSQFNVIRAEHADLLREKLNNIYIWCHANQYVEMHNLKGFYTGMFISEMYEAKHYNIHTATSEELTESNDLFVAAVARYKHLPSQDLLTEVVKMYGAIRTRNPIVEYNVNLLGAR